MHILRFPSPYLFVNYNRVDSLATIIAPGPWLREERERERFCGGAPFNIHRAIEDGGCGLTMRMSMEGCILYCIITHV